MKNEKNLVTKTTSWQAENTTICKVTNNFNDKYYLLKNKEFLLKGRNICGKSKNCEFCVGKPIRRILLKKFSRFLHFCIFFYT